MKQSEANMSGSGFLESKLHYSRDFRI
uniref:Uncharacterized protein n=1 Tax=Arundo donax TaxID=35708 RepID=A0A0A9C8G7_ARUDO